MGPLLVALVLTQPFTIERDAYGVPRISGPSASAVYEGMGYAVAQDRLWQLELSRRIARGTMAEVFGSEYVASDVSVFKLGYSDAEIETMLKQLGRDRGIFTLYAQGINRCILERKANGTLPPDYAKNGFEPAPWTELDSAAICIRMARLFGNGGEGELRNLLLTYYLKGQPVGDKYLDAVDDLAWWNDPDSPVTDSSSHPYEGSGFPEELATRAQTEAQLKAIPPTSLFELLPAVRLAGMEDSRLVAEAHGVSYKTGSYAIAVSKDRSATSNALLLGAPQMGHTIPSVVHEVSLNAPGLTVSGMGVPGIPGVLIGATKKIAWTLTSGVADMTDIEWHSKVDNNTYKMGDSTLSFVKRQGLIKVRGAEAVTVEQVRTIIGPVLLDSRVGKAVYAQRSAFWKKELAGFNEIWALPSQTSVKGAIDKMDVPLSFNFFAADESGDIGWKYCGWFPSRSGIDDSRFPRIAGPNWHRELYTFGPEVINPAGGLITNWNNKPVPWWPNWDTPVWGKHFRVTALRQSLPSGKLTAKDLEQAATKIAQRDEGSWTSFMPMIRRAISPASFEGDLRQAASILLSYDGWNKTGSKSAVIYSAVISQLKQEVFVPKLGTFLSPQNLNLVIQTSPLDKALNQKTKVDYLAGRSVNEVIAKAFTTAAEALIRQRGKPGTWSYNPGGIRAPDSTVVPYINRGTYIQIIEMNKSARSVAGPGASETGKHCADQIPLNRDWGYKPMWRP